AERGEGHHRIAQECARALLRDFGVKAGIDDKGFAAAFCHPHEVIHRHRPVMRIATDKVRAALRVPGGIADGKQLVIDFAHDVSCLASADAMPGEASLPPHACLPRAGNFASAAHAIIEASRIAVRKSPGTLLQSPAITHGTPAASANCATSRKGREPIASTMTSPAGWRTTSGPLPHKISPPSIATTGVP